MLHKECNDHSVSNKEYKDYEIFFYKVKVSTWICIHPMNKDAGTY